PPCTLRCSLSTSFSVSALLLFVFLGFFFIAPAATELCTLSLHDALPIFGGLRRRVLPVGLRVALAHRRHQVRRGIRVERSVRVRSEEHTSELQSRENLVCRLLLEKKKKT